MTNVKDILVTNGKNVMEKVGTKAAPHILKVKKYSPQILFVAGVVTFVGTTVEVYRATTKAEAVLDELEASKQRIKDVVMIDDVDYTEADFRKDMFLVHAQAVMKIGRVYLPAFALGALSISCFAGSNYILQSRNVALMAAYDTMSKAYDAYRERVTEDYGEEYDRDVREGVKRSIVKEKVKDPETGKMKTVDKMIFEPTSSHSPYARLFDNGSREWSVHPEYNWRFLETTQKMANDMLKARGHLFLNEVYDMLDIPRTREGAIVGWVYGTDEGDNFVDFGFDILNPQVRDFINGREEAIWLDFNVQGVIYDLI